MPPTIRIRVNEMQGRYELIRKPNNTKVGFVMETQPQTLIQFVSSHLPIGDRSSMKYGIALYRISCSMIPKLNTSPFFVPRTGRSSSGIRSISGAVHSCFQYVLYSPTLSRFVSKLRIKSSPTWQTFTCQWLSTKHELLRRWPWDTRPDLWRYAMPCKCYTECRCSGKLIDKYC